MSNPLSYAYKKRIADLERAITETKHDLKQIENHCPCGARPDSLNTHPHVISCPVERALNRIEQILKGEK